MVYSAQKAFPTPERGEGEEEKPVRGEKGRKEKRVKHVSFAFCRTVSMRHTDLLRWKLLKKCKDKAAKHRERNRKRERLTSFRSTGGESKQPPPSSFSVFFRLGGMCGHRSERALTLFCLSHKTATLVMALCPFCGCCQWALLHTWPQA